VLLAYTMTFCRLVLVFVFGLSLAGKLADRGHFTSTIGAFGLLPARLHQAAAALILAGEFAALGLLAGGWLRIGFALAGLLLILFTVALASVLRRGIQTPCNCFGPSEKLVSPTDLWRNAGLICCAAGGCWAAWGLQGNGYRLTIAEWALFVIAAALLVLIGGQLHAIASMFSNL
jgi:hypothetical protein